MTQLRLNGYDAIGIRAANPGPFTLTGTNTWILGRDPAWLVDPGPALPDHERALAEEVAARGGLGAILLTHDHPDHADGLPALRERLPGVPVAAARGPVDRRLADGDTVGPLTALALRGHAPDHLVFRWDSLVCCGDAVLGEGSVFIAPDPGALAAYLDGLARLRALAPRLLLPGHGPVITDPEAKLDEYIEHRRERERRLLEALASGARSVDALLDGAWPEVPEPLRPAAAVTLAAHLDKLADEGRLPEGVQRPELGLAS